MSIADSECVFEPRVPDPSFSFTILDCRADAGNDVSDSGLSEVILGFGRPRLRGFGVEVDSDDDELAGTSLYSDE